MTGLCCKACTTHSKMMKIEWCVFHFIIAWSAQLFWVIKQKWLAHCASAVMMMPFIAYTTGEEPGTSWWALEDELASIITAIDIPALLPRLETIWWKWKPNFHDGMKCWPLLAPLEKSSLLSSLLWQSAFRPRLATNRQIVAVYFKLRLSHSWRGRPLPEELYLRGGSADQTRPDSPR